MSMQMVLRKEWEAIDGSTGNKTIISAGTHDIERIKNPRGFEAQWLVLKGTVIGGSELSWRQWKNGLLACDPQSANYGKPIQWGEFEVVILNDDTPVNGYVIMNSEGTTLSRDLLWGTNKQPLKGYVHTQESLDIIRISCLTWNTKPAVIYPATIFNGETVVNDPEPF